MLRMILKSFSNSRHSFKIARATIVRQREKHFQISR